MGEQDCELGLDDLQALVARSEYGDAAALRDLRRLMETNIEAWGIVGSLGKHIKRYWLDVVLRNQQIARQAVEVEMQRMKADLCGPNPSTLEDLVAERIAVCWLQLQYVEARCAQTVGDGNHSRDENLQKRLDRAHRRFLSAVKTMASVQRLRTPSLQVNIAEKQANINGVSPGDWPKPLE